MITEMHPDFRPNEGQCSAEMPKYVSYKEVWALKIKAIEKIGDAIKLTFEDQGFAARIVTSEELAHKPVPEAGWYMVQYKDGYLSFFPGATFEVGYRRV
jgi:hypothetical protein